MWVRTLVKSAACAAFVFAVRSAYASYEGFNYSGGSNLSGQNGGSGWSSAWDEPADDPDNTVADVVAPGSLSYSNLSTSGGHAVAGGQINFVGRRTSGLNTSDGNSTWLSFLIRHDTVGDGAGFPAEDPDYGGLEIGTGGAEPQVFVGALGGPNTGKYGLDTAITGAGQQASSTSEVLGQTALLVARIDWAAGSDNISLFVNPIIGGSPGSADAIKNDVDLANLNSVGITTGVNAFWSIDEIRIGDSFSAVAPAENNAVIPLPSALFAFPGTAVMAAALARRFRRKTR